MRRTVAASVFLVLWMVSGAAQAASIALHLDPLGGDQWALRVTSSLGAPGLGAVNVETFGITGMLLNTSNTGISVLNSVFVAEVFGPGANGFLIINNVFPPAAAIAGPGSQGVLLATLTANVPLPHLVPAETNAGSPTFWDVQRLPLGPPSMRLETLDGGRTLRLVPEPVVSALLLTGLAAVVTRRRAR